MRRRRPAFSQKYRSWKEIEFAGEKNAEHARTLAGISLYLRASGIYSGTDDSRDSAGTHGLDTLARKGLEAHTRKTDAALATGAIEARQNH